MSPEAKKQIKWEYRILICTLLTPPLQFQIDQISPYRLWSILTVSNTNQVKGLWKECS